MLVAYSSSVKFLRNGFPGVKLLAKFEVVLPKSNFYQSLRITRNQTLYRILSKLKAKKFVKFIPQNFS